MEPIDKIEKREGVLFKRIINYEKGGPCVLTIRATVQKISKMKEEDFLEAIHHVDHMSDPVKMDSSEPYPLTPSQLNESGTHILIGWEFDHGAGAVRLWIGFQVSIYVDQGGTMLVRRMSYDTIGGFTYEVSMGGEAFHEIYYRDVEAIVKPVFEMMTSFFWKLKSEKVHV